ncbi:beta-ketoacyl synthase N-terminal-like domain-containing protein [Nonomuraea sp. SBT364]|uniref:beta-ketoacyl synthase N-terminal-like domain-containing protein n=1 Tax=Nonomuraea sp. SBT364 TaxID=1580530 RepID=UPI00066CB2A3|nr:beta-ketoacyl synthase N-terminal-like domain-containing protein [Nonomuraea sp. SBT364]
MDELVISGCSVISPFGLGVEAFAAGLASGTRPMSATSGGPYAGACLIPDFDARTVLGAKGTRTMDRATAIAVASVGMLLDTPVTEHPHEVGLVLGTSSGSIQSIMDFTRESLVGDKPYHVDPARFPNTVMNRAAGQSAIWHGLKGPNATVAGGAATGLLALNYATRLLRRGRCKAVLCGAVEEYSEQRGWLAWHAGRREVPPGEGSAIFLLESREDAAAASREPLAAVLGSRFMVHERAVEVPGVLTACVRGLLKDLGLRAEDIGAVLSSGAEGEDAALDAIVGPHAPRRNCREALGDTASAASAFQLAAAVTGGPSGAVTLVTSVDRDGVVGCTALQLERAA